MFVAPRHNQWVQQTSTLLPALALIFNAFVWGCSWWPFRRLELHGLHPLWTTVIVYALAVLVIAMLRPRAFSRLLRTPTLWILVLASGMTNAAFNWAVVIGDVVRVVLLFYLMPLWSVLLARLLLDEPLTRAAGLRVLLALSGAAIVLWPEAGSGSSPLPHALPDWLGLIGGFSFALNNVMLRREAGRPEEDRALAMFAGGVLVAGGLAIALAAQAELEWPPAPAPQWLVMVGLLTLVFIASNMALQFGASRLAAHVTAVVMLSEVLFASVSAVWWGDGRLDAPLVAGGTLIVAAAVLAATGARQAAMEARALS